MKKLILLLVITLFTLNTNNLMAQKANKTETIIIKTSTQCNMCKERVEKAMAYEKGVKSSSLNVEKQEFTITYKPNKTAPEKIRTAISKLGYDADNVKAIKKSHDELPNCCQKGGHM